MKIIQLYFSLFFLLSINAYAQKETYNWFYGSGQGISWSRTQDFEGIPIDAPNTTVTLKGIPMRYEPESVRPEMYPLSTREGCFSISDENGKLLFYSNGIEIFNANHVNLENGDGISGHQSSAQSGIIVPLPQHKKKYVAISIGIARGYGEFRYNILDAEANNGLGKLELPKNRAFTLPPASNKLFFVESVAATKHANGVDYWIIAIERNVNKSRMVAWLLTKDGISTTPVATLIPNLNTNAGYGAYGYLKMSPNGQYFALMMYENGNLLWGEFNNSTGVFSNMNNHFALTLARFYCYGGEFSPDGKYLYVSSGVTTTKLATVFDFQELLNGNTTPLRTYEMRTNTYTSGALQLGPDLRMYLTMDPPNKTIPRPSIMYVFDNPNEPLTTGVYALKDLSPGTGSRSDGYSGTRLGLPTFASSFFVQIEGTSTLCIGEEAVYEISSNAGRIEIDFDEGDGPIIIDNVPELRHSFKKPGNYLIKVRPLNSSGDPVRDEIKTIYTTVYSCYLPVNHNLINTEY